MQSRFSAITKQITSELPKWFEIRKNTQSVGAQFINIFGLQYEDIEYYLQYAFDNQFIDSADIGQVDIIYKATLPSSLTPEDHIVIVGESMVMNEALSLKEFLTGLNPPKLANRELYYANPFFVDWDRKVIYLKRAYDVNEEYTEGKIRLIVSNSEGKLYLETEVPTGVHHVWNFFDEFGLLLDTPRLYGERNLDYKERILDVFRHPANSSYVGLQYSLARELGLWKTEPWLDAGVDLTLRHANIILNSVEVDGVKWDEANTFYDRSDRLVLRGNEDDIGKTKTVRFIAGLEMHTFHNKKDYAFQEELYSIDRLATPMLQYYVDAITNHVPVLWGQFVWNESFWDIADVGMSGYGYIPSFNDPRFLNWSKYKN